MRMETVSSEVLQKSQVNAVKRRALESLEQKINEAAAQAERKMNENHHSNAFDDFQSGEQTISSLCELEMERRYRRRQVITFP